MRGYVIRRLLALLPTLLLASIIVFVTANDLTSSTPAVA